MGKREQVEKHKCERKRSYKVKQGSGEKPSSL